jgi:aspartate racemase
MMAKRIGILGGISAASTVEYYRRLIEKAIQRRGDYHTPEIVIYSLDFQRFTDLEDGNDRDGYVEEIMKGIRALEAAGVDFALMAANSPHAVFDQVAARAAAPMISIVRVTARSAQRRRLTRLLLLGIRFTMSSAFYPEACAELGIDVLVPSPEEQDEINHIIFAELARSVFRPESKARLLDIIAQYPVDGVILGCTELPLILSQEDTPVVLLDTLDLHVEAALKYALA